MVRGKGQWIFAFGVGLLVAIAAHQWAGDPAWRQERRLEESVVASARTHLTRVLARAELQLVDPLAPNRSVGKAYVYRRGDGWEVSGYYRRDDDDRWHPFLMQLDSTQNLTHLRIQDPALAEPGVSQPALEIIE